jgi:hypothetical protein
MKSILRIFADIVLLPVTGCIFPANRDYSDADAPAPATLNLQGDKVELKAAGQKK